MTRSLKKNPFVANRLFWANQIQESDELLWKQRLYVFFQHSNDKQKEQLNGFLIPFFHWHRPLFNRQL